MNIIANNCVGGEIYKLTNQRYENPFIWSIITGDDFTKLINQYKDINFDNIEVKKCFLEDYNNSISIKIDNNIYVHFIHYIKDDNYDTPTSVSEIKNEPNRDLLYKNADILCEQKYNDRLKRMTEQPIFIITPSQYFLYSDVIRCMNSNSCYKKIFLLPNTFIFPQNISLDNCEIILYDGDEDKLKYTTEKAIFLLNNSNILKNVITK